MTQIMQFDAISENLPADKWLSRWNRSWPAYKQWFVQRGGPGGPSKTECERALQNHMPELHNTWKTLCKLTGDDDMAAQFLSTWCPPAYLGGCSLAAKSQKQSSRLVRNYDLSPELNEGLLMRTAWNGTPVMGMVEFLWGLSDGINDHGLAIALAFGGSSQVGEGFGITTILRYIMETCQNVEQALDVLRRVPSHMAYNIIVADASGRNAVVEVSPGGGMRLMKASVSTNHQHQSPAPDKAAFTQTYERYNHLLDIVNSDVSPDRLADEFLKPPLFQDKYAGAMGTLFTADYDTKEKSLNLRWTGTQWIQSLDCFKERSQQICYGLTSSEVNRQTWSSHSGNTYGQATPQASMDWLDQLQKIEPFAADRPAFVQWLEQARTGDVNWATFSSAFSHQHAC